MHPQRIGALTGALFVLLAIAAFVVGGETPDTDDSAAKIVAFYVDNDTEQIVAALLLGWASVALLFFTGTLRQHLGRSGRDSSLPFAVLLGGAMIAVGATVFAGLTFALGDAADDMPAAAVVALNTLNSDLFFPLAVGVAVFNLGLGLAVVRHGGLPRALGWVAIVVGIAAVTPLGFFAFLATGLVILVVSVLLAMRAGTPQASGYGAPASG
jgi:hypothetical protein